MDIKFVQTLKSKISDNKLISDDMANVCFAIIDHVAVAPKQKPHLTFTDLYRVSPEVSDENIFYDAVFLLTRPPYNVLTQEFEAWHPRNGYTQVPNREDIIEDMRTGKLYNPFTGERLNETEFGKQVLTYFSPSNELIQAIGDV